MTFGREARTTLTWVMGMLLGLLAATPAHAFSLLGPFAPWMETRIGYRLPGDIGGPMILGEEYRWNLPVVTYGFDQSFVAYFGTNGVAAVESAIATLNDLPAASVLNPDDFASDTRHANSAAQAALLIDLKSAALSTLLEQMGLTTPKRYTWTLRDLNILGQNPPTTNYTVVRRNFDPVTALPSDTVNGAVFSYQIVDPVNAQAATRVADAVEQLVQGDTAADTAVAGTLLPSGQYFSGLTRDDVGGLRYLLSRDNLNVETLPADVTAVGPQPTAFVNTALRPGVEKITFVRVSYDSLLEQSPPFTNVFTDVIYSNSVPTPQTLQRIITHPDIVFSAADLEPDASGFTVAVQRSLTNWENQAESNGDPDGAGPGVIRPGARIVFNKAGQMLINLSYNTSLDLDNATVDVSWGSFGFGQNVPVLYPSGTALPLNKTAALRMEGDNNSPELLWRLWAVPEQTYRIQYSTNLTDWTTITNIYNETGLLEFRAPASTTSGRIFYRAITP